MYDWWNRAKWSDAVWEITGLDGEVVAAGVGLAVIAITAAIAVFFWNGRDE